MKGFLFSYPNQDLFLPVETFVGRYTSTSSVLMTNGVIIHVLFEGNYESPHMYDVIISTEKVNV